jgi:hypothetical protein
MARYNIVPSKLRLINPKAYREAKFACTGDGERCQLTADKIISPHADALWRRFRVRFIPSYDSGSHANRRARREGQFISDYTRRVSRGAYSRGYASIRDVTDSTAWRKYGIANTA